MSTSSPQGPDAVRGAIPVTLLADRLTEALANCWPMCASHAQPRRRRVIDWRSAGVQEVPWSATCTPSILNLPKRGNLPSDILASGDAPIPCERVTLAADSVLEPGLDPDNKASRTFGRSRHADDEERRFA